MPSTSVYIRKEDYEKWLSIDNKADFISKALKGTPQAAPASETKTTTFSNLKQQFDPREDPDNISYQSFDEI
jgi:hypothetical protein